MPVVLAKPSRDLLEAAAGSLMVYAMLRRTLGRDLAFVQWCDILELDDLRRMQLAHIRIQLLQDMAAGKITYDDIDWTGTDEDLRASSTKTMWVIAG